MERAPALSAALPRFGCLRAANEKGTGKEGRPFSTNSGRI